jgi:hypothetical protein
MLGVSMSISMLSALLLAGAAPSVADRGQIDAAVQGIFGAYADPGKVAGSLDAPIYSTETAALIAHWKRVTPSDEVDELSDSDWFCQCQEWDAATFRTTIVRREILRANVARVAVRLMIGWNTNRDARIVLKREGGRWLADDLFFSEMPKGLKQKLRETIVEDEALARKAR